MLITFNIKTLKLLKNALIFSVLGVLRNLLALLGIVLLVALHIFLIFLLLPIGVSIPFILPFFYIVAVIGFISVYAAYPIIDKYMIAPYKAAYSDDNCDDEESNNDNTDEVTSENK